jgi:hypothetical protein
MKFTSIVFAALVAATQFSCTFAANGSNQAVATSASTYLDTAVTINVAGTDTVQTSVGVASTKSIKDALVADITDYTIVIGSVDTTTTNTKGTVALVAGTAKKPFQLMYTPASGFIGTDTFSYKFSSKPVSSGTPFGAPTGIESSPATVTVTVSATPIKQTFEIPGLVSSGDAVKSTQVGLSNIAAFTPGAPDAGVFKAIAMPVIGSSADFAANTSTEVVQQNFSTIFNSFYNFFRGGN